MCTAPVYMDSLYVHLSCRFGRKGLLVAFLVLLTLGMGVCEAMAAEPTSEVEKASQMEKSWRLGSGKGFSVLDNDDKPGGTLQTMIVYSMIILVLGVGAVLVVKKLLPRIQRSAGKNLSIIETAYISPRSSVHLLRVGTKKYLISRSGEGISLLAEVTQALEDAESTSGSGE